MTIPEYYERVPEKARAPLQALRGVVLGVLDDPEEKISYQIPHFIYKGKRIVAIAGWKNHLALYPLSTTALQIYSKELANFQTSAGTVQFSFDQKLPKDVIRSIVKTRLNELFDT